MPLLYHRVPEGLSGDILYPLNQLKHIHPAAYRLHVNKYWGREWLQGRNIPGLQLRWGDALQLSAIPPSSIKRAMASMGLKFGGEFFEIDAEVLDPMFATVFLYQDDVDIDQPFEQKDFAAYSPNDVGKWSQLGQATLRHYKECKMEGREVFPYYRTPHILYAETLTIDELKRIKV